MSRVSFDRCVLGPFLFWVLLAVLSHHRRRRRRTRPLRQDGPHFVVHCPPHVFAGCTVGAGGGGRSQVVLGRRRGVCFRLFCSPRSSKAVRGQSKAVNGPRGSTSPRRTRLVYKRVWQEVGETAARAGASFASSARGRRALCAASPQSLTPVPPFGPHGWWLNV